MRFIITQLGENLIKVIDEEQTSKKTKDLKSMLNSFSAKLLKVEYYFLLKKILIPLSQERLSNLSQARIIEIYLKRLNIQKTIN